MLNEKQKWILFLVFIVAFTLITLLTIWGVFFGLKNLPDSYRDKLFYALVIEIIGAVILLFRTGFGISKGEVSQRKIWLNFPDGMDIRKFVGRDVTCSPRAEDGTPIGDDIINKVLKDQALYVMPKLPNETESVFVMIEFNDEVYEGSFPVKSYMVDLEEQLL